MSTTKLMEEVAAIREDLQRSRAALSQLEVPANAPLFGKNVTDAIHHVGVASLQLSNALVLGLPGARA